MKIQETPENYINFAGQSIEIDAGKKMLIVTDRDKIMELDIPSGKLKSYFILSDSIINFFHTKFKERNRNLSFLDEKIDSTSKFTARIGRIWFDKVSKELSVDLTFQFKVKGLLDGQESIIWSFFTGNCKITNGKIDRYLFLSDIQEIKTNYSTKNDSYPIYFSGLMAMYNKENKLLTGVVSNVLNDTTKLLANLKVTNGNVVLQELLPVYPNPEIHRRKDQIFTRFTFSEFNKTLYFTDCRSLFNLKTYARTDLITDKFWSVLDFKFLDENHILSYQKCDTNRQVEVGVYELKKNSSKYSRLDKFDDTFFTFGENIYEIKKVKDSYYLRTYTLEE